MQEGEGDVGVVSGRSEGAEKWLPHLLRRRSGVGRHRE